MILFDGLSQKNQEIANNIVMGVEIATNTIALFDEHKRIRGNEFPLSVLAKSFEGGTDGLAEFEDNTIFLTSNLLEAFQKLETSNDNLTDKESLYAFYVLFHEIGHFAVRLALEKVIEETTDFNSDEANILLAHPLLRAYEEISAETFARTAKATLSENAESNYANIFSKMETFFWKDFELRDLYLDPCRTYFLETVYGASSPEQIGLYYKDLSYLDPSKIIELIMKTDVIKLKLGLGGIENPEQNLQPEKWRIKLPKSFIDFEARVWNSRSGQNLNSTIVLAV